MNISELESKYGLPQEVVHCQSCLMTNQKPFSVNETKNYSGSQKSGLLIYDDQRCAACHYNDNKFEGIDWELREKMLYEMLDKYRRTDGYYDCIVSGSGGKDSTTIAHILKYKYGMNPLTVTYSPVLYTEVGWRNVQNWIYDGGFDNFLFSPNGKVVSVLARQAFENLLHPMQPFKFGIKSYAAKMAIRMGIKLVMYGEPYAEYGSEQDDSTDSPSYNLDWYVNDSKDIYLGGVHVDDLIEKHGLSRQELNPFMPLRSDDVKSHDVQVEFLGWYIKWNPQEIYYYASENCGFEPDPQRTDGTYGRYAGVDDKFEWIHYFSHYIKYGIGRCRFDASQEIRSGHITREEGIRLLRKFEGEVPYRYLYDCIEFMGMSEAEFWKVVDKARSPHLWGIENGHWKPLQELPELMDDPVYMDRVCLPVS